MTPGTGPGGIRGDGAPGPARGSEPMSPSVFAELLRRALHAAADQAEPCTDGLAPIRARILARAGVPWPQALAISRYWLGPK